MALKTLMMLVILNSLTACGNVVIRPQLPLPEKQVGPRVDLIELSCLNKGTQKRIAQLVINKNARIKRLRKIITDHNKR